MELTDASVTTVGDYAAQGVVNFHHNMDQGRVGVVADANTLTQDAASNLEFDPGTGKLVNFWDLGQIISAAMIAGGDDPKTFVTGTATDWFHNNGAIYSKADNALIVSSREDFIIAVDNDTPPDGQKKIHWILGDPTKLWYQYPSLRKFALTLAPGTLPPIGQHAPSIDDQGNLLVFDDGFPSLANFPQGDYRPASAIREYIIDRQAMTATAGFVYAPNPAIFSNFCGSAYESGGSYLVDFAQANSGNTLILQGVDANQNVIFDLEIPGSGCNLGWNATPIKSNIFVFPN